MSRADSGVEPGPVRLDVETPPCVAGHTPRLVEACLRFGVSLSVPGRVVVKGLELDLRPGTVTLVVGPSGSGKSLLLDSIAKQRPASRLLSQVPFPSDTAVLDSVAPGQSVYDALEVLTACGLGEPMLWIRRFHQLSDGERFRARLARAISQQGRMGGHAPLLCDEFGAILHRRLAQAIAFNLRRLVSREKLSLVVATSQEDIEEHLRPDTVVRLGDDVDETVVERCKRRPALRLATGRRTASALKSPFAVRVVRGRLKDYARFAGMHYRQRDQVGFVEQVFVMKERYTKKLLGVVVYGMPALELRLRNRVTGGRFVRNARLLNQEVRVLKRLVIHPDVRGCGLGHLLVRRTLPRVGVRFVECLAAMGAVHPVFDKAGMRRVGTVEPPKDQARTLGRLIRLGADPLAADFSSQVCRRPAVRRLVADTVFNWYQCTAGGGERRVARQSPTLLAQTYQQLAGSQPVYFIWAEDRKGRALINEHADDEVDGNERWADESTGVSVA